MTILYRCPAHRPIAQSVWRSLYADPSIRHSIFAQEDAYRVTLTWVGLASSAERRPAFWLIEVAVVNGLGSLTARPELDRWCVDRIDAERQAKALVEQLESGAILP